MVSRYKMGELDVKLQRFESAIAHFEAGIAVLNGMIAKRLNETAATREKGILERRLAFCWGCSGDRRLGRADED